MANMPSPADAPAGDPAPVEQGQPGSLEMSRLRLPALSMATYRALFAVSLIVPLILFTMVAWQTHDAVSRRIASDIFHTTDMAADHAENLLTVHKLVAERVSESLHGMSWDEIAHSEAVHAYLAHIRDEYPQVQAIWLADASGRVRNASEVLPETAVMVVQRDYFQALRKADVGTFVGQMVQAQVMKGLNFNVARRRESPTGVFDGVVIVTVFQNYFIEFWNDLAPQESALFGLIRTEGAILARRPPLNDTSTVLAPDSPLMQAMGKADEGTYRAVSTVDGIDRLIGFRRLPGFNLVVVHAIRWDALYDEWWRNTLAYAVFFGIATLALAALSLLAMRQAHREQRATAEWKQTALRLREEEAKVRTLNDVLSRHSDELEVVNKELEMFSYSVSHDLRVPLRAIHGFSEILLEEYAEKLDAEGKRLLGVVCDSATKMGQLIDDILRFARSAQLPMDLAEVDMAGQVQGVIADLRAQAGDREITFEVGALPNAAADEAMLRQVWVNLLDNAIKFTASRQPAVITVHGERIGNEIIYSVADNGIGFNMQFVGKLFGVGNRLVGTDFHGSGIGLALVKRIITRHGGRVWAEGVVGGGATFYCALPEKDGEHA